MNEIWNCSYFNPVQLVGTSTAGAGNSYTYLVFGSSTCASVSSTAPAYSGGFSYGEAVMSVFLFLIFLTLAYQFIFNWTRGVKIGKKGV